MKNRLAPYADSELAGGELAEFESHLRECPTCTADTLSLMRMKQMVRTAAITRYSPSAEFRLRMEESIRAKNIHSKQSLSWFRIPMPKLFAAAAVAMLLIASVIFWMGRARNERAVAELTDLHVTTLASANPVDVVSTDRHTVKPWFAGKIPFSFNVPELQNSEFELDGGRVAYFQHSSGAQLLFNLRKHQLSVFIFNEQSVGNRFRGGTRSSNELGLHVETWSEGGLRYFVVSDAAASDVHALAELMRSAAHS